MEHPAFLDHVLTGNPWDFNSCLYVYCRVPKSTQDSAGATSLSQASLIISVQTLHRHRRRAREAKSPVAEQKYMPTTPHRI